MKTALLTATLLLAGCRELSGLDEFAVGEEAPQPAPYLSGPACSACLEAKCSAELAACDAQCSKVLACRRKETNPDEHFMCSYLQEDDEHNWVAGAGTAEGRTRPADRDVADCARRKCSSACSIGSSWACVGGYDWSDPYAGFSRGDTLTIRHRAFKDGHWDQAVEGASIEACSADQSFCPLLGKTNLDGRVEGTLENTWSFDDSRVALKIEKDGFPTHIVLGKDRRRYTYEYTSQSMSSVAKIEDISALFGWKWDPQRGYLMVGFNDCALMAPMKDLKLEVRVEPDELPCADCRVVTYGVAQDPPGRMALISTKATGLPQLVEITVRDPDDPGNTLSKTHLYVAPNRLHTVNLMPRTSNEVP